MSLLKNLEQLPVFRRKRKSNAMKGRRAPIAESWEGSNMGCILAT